MRIDKGKIKGVEKWRNKGGKDGEETDWFLY